MTPDLSVQWGIALIIAALAAIGILLVQMRAHNRRLGEDSDAMLDRWEDEPGIIPDPLAEELERLLKDGDHRG